MAPPDPDRLLEGLALFGMRLGLESTRRLLADLGSPHLRVPTVLVAGTNGKGSTAALLAAMATAAGYRTGLYTSPHLESVEERLRLDGVAIERPRLGTLLDEVLAAARPLSPHLITYFEALTAAAFLHFAREAVDLAVLEVGLGGRLDATNAGEPMLSLITSIGLDHQQHLGASLTEIAREKAGILRTGRPALCWIEEPEAMGEVRGAAARLGAELHSAPEEVRWSRLRRKGWYGQSLLLETPLQVLELEMQLLGAHQLANLGLAVRAAEVLREAGWNRFDGDALRRGAAACRWPGRLEVIEIECGRRVLVDAAHNPAAAAQLRSFLDGLDEPLDLLFGALGDKDVRGVLAALAGRFRQVTLTRPESPRAMPAADLAPLLPAGESFEVEDDLAAALARALDVCAGTLVVCGSIFLAGPVRRLLREGPGRGLPPAAADVRTGPPPGA